MAAHRLYFHLTWSTLDRRAMIDGPTREFLDGFFRRAAVRERALVVELAILSTHVHLLVRTRPRFDLGRLVQMLKGGSSYAVNRLPGNITGLRWTREYSATTVGPRGLARAKSYCRARSEDIRGMRPLRH
jgi:REP element-mobilizing transposase RayT